MGRGRPKIKKEPKKSVPRKDFSERFKGRGEVP